MVPYILPGNPVTTQESPRAWIALEETRHFLRCKRRVIEVSVISFDYDLEDGALVYDYNKGEHRIQLSPGDPSGSTTCAYSLLIDYILQSSGHDLDRPTPPLPTKAGRITRCLPPLTSHPNECARVTTEQGPCTSSIPRPLVLTCDLSSRPINMVQMRMNI